MTLKTQIQTINAALKAAVNESPIQQVTFTDNFTNVAYPGVQFLLTACNPDTENDLFPTDFRAWQLEYDVTVYSKTDYASAVDVVNEVYDKLQDENTGKLSGNCEDIQVDGIEYGYVQIGINEPEIMSGGQIKLIIKIFEQR